MAVSGFVEAEIVASRLRKQYKSKQWDSYTVEEWCGQVEVEKVRDLNLMWEFRAVPLIVGEDLSLLIPCNLYKIIEVYNESKTFLEYNRNDTHLFDIREMFNQEPVKAGDTIYISFYGMPVNKQTGAILIPSGHESLCETYCKLIAFEEDTAFGRFDKDMYFKFDQKFSGLLQAARSSHKSVDRTKRLRKEIINGNMLPRIGRLPIKNEEIY